MGRFNPFKAAKKVVKTVTKPIAKVLDKVVPNELKPFLPYVAAVAPVLGPKLGILSNLTKAQAAGFYGGSSLLSQLAQEGSEGDFDLAPIIAAAGTGFLAQPGTGISSLEQIVPGQTSLYPELTAGEKIKNIGIQGLQAAEEFVQAPGFKATAKALAPTVSTQITQDAVNFAKQAEADFLAEQAEFDRLAGEQQAASDADRRAAIIASMTRANFAQDIIDETLDQLGLKDGGVVKMKEGGIMDLGGKEMDMRTGGFIPIGAKERADDVPARLSKNEFVMTADAVRAAGGGSVNKGAKRMYDLMHKLEARA